MKIRAALLVTLIAAGAGGCLPATTAPPSETERLEAALTALADGLDGVAGIHARRLDGWEEVAVRADELFPTASMIKVPLLVALFDRVEAGALALDTELAWHDSLSYPGNDITAKLREGETVSLERLAFLMTSWSDNTASLWIQALVGGGATVNDLMGRMGLEHTRVNSRTPGRQPDWERYGWGQTTPREMSGLMARIHAGEAVSAGASRAMYGLLTAPFYREEALASIPPTIQVATKPGAVSASRSETLVVNAPAGPYVLTVITREQADTSREDDNPGWQLIREASRLVWDAWGVR
jgi:beta-lactamase class A